MSRLAGIGAPADMGLEPRRRPRRDAASLRQLYVEEGLTVAALAARFGVDAAIALIADQHAGLRLRNLPPLPPPVR